MQTGSARIPPQSGRNLYPPRVTEQGGAMKKLVLMAMLALPLAAGLATAMVGSITTAYADPPDPKP